VRLLTKFHFYSQKFAVRLDLNAAMVYNWVLIDMGYTQTHLIPIYTAISAKERSTTYVRI